MPRKKKTTARKSSAGEKSRKTKKGTPKSPVKKDTGVASDQLQLLDLSTEKLAEELGKIKAITPYSVASTFDLNVGKAKNLLRTLEEQGLIRCVGGNSRIRIYVPTTS
jgi:ribosomal protein S25